MASVPATIIPFPLEQTGGADSSTQGKSDATTSHRQRHDKPLKARFERFERSDNESFNEGQAEQGHSIDTEQLYYNKQAVSQELSLALHLLNRCSSSAQSALAEMDRNDGRYTINADEQIQQIQATLPDLYTCRELGDGFAGVVLGLQFAFDNLQGDPLTRRQIQALASLLERLHDEPFISHSRAMDYLIKFEESGFKTEPVELEALLNIFDEQD